MRRPAGLPLPAFDAAAPIRVRVAAAPDADSLAAVLAGAFPDKDWNSDRAVRTFFDDPTVHTTFLACDTHGKPVATATARVDTVNFPGEGYVHWVATHPDSQRQGLGNILMHRVLQTFADLGLPSAVLETDDHRLPAIRLYLALGFEPVIWHESHAERWEIVRHMVGDV